MPANTPNEVRFCFVFVLEGSFPLDFFAGIVFIYNDDPSRLTLGHSFMCEYGVKHCRAYIMRFFII